MKRSFLFQFGVLDTSEAIGNEEVSNQPAKDLAQFVSEYLGVLQDCRSNLTQDIFFDKKIVIKEENGANLKSRLTELIKYEEGQRVIFGIFTTEMTREEACKAGLIFGQIFGQISSNLPKFGNKVMKRSKLSIRMTEMTIPVKLKGKSSQL